MDERARNVSGVAKQHYKERTMEETFRAFDRLPRAIRTALNDANFKYDPVWIMEQWKTNRNSRTARRFVADMKAYFEKFERTL